LIKDQFVNETQPTSILSLNFSLFKINEKFLKELMKKAHFDKANGLIKIEIDTFIFGNLILILKVIQHKSNNRNNDLKRDEQHLEILIKSYFKNLDDQNNQIYDRVYDDDDDDLSSQYSTLSSILGIRVFIFY
jgi:hypothetical protein